MSCAKNGIWTIIGAGHAGYSLIGRLGTWGYRIRVLDTDKHKVAAIDASGGLHVEGGDKDFAPVELASTDPAQALRGADVIVVCTYGTAHAQVAETIAPFLEDGQTILLLQGNMAGALIVRRALERAGCRAHVDVADMDSSPFQAKVLAADRVLLTGMKARWQLAAMPASRTAAVLERVGAAFRGMVAATNLLHTGFADLGGVFHVGGIITNVSRVEDDGDYHFYSSNMVPSVCNLLLKLDAERVAIARAYDVAVPDAVSWLASTYRMEPSSLHDMLHALASTAYKYSPAPKSLQHRFLVQDVGCTLVAFSALGQAAGIPSPTTDAAIEIAGALTGHDFWHEGRSLDALGIAGMTPQEIVEYIS
ncbi:NAD/NADP octopine/nopaline dehydrogenase family protein [Castellaniella sp. GW247-6E4]|uniref:NAD/NADP octopine/nopaline dehydrogenase family protein n=1 Tax=Castellaniella sp. GW247-6E4 TaxID=3140380 RepID=UPI003315E23D